MLPWLIKVKAEKEKNAKANITDPDSRIMKTRRGFIQGYNAQAMATEGQVIVAAELTQEESDYNQLHPMIEKTYENLEEAGMTRKVGAVVADAGYLSENNLSASFRKYGVVSRAGRRRSLSARDRVVLP